jgi:hypothetical protein
MTISSGIPAIGKVSADPLPIDSEAISSPHTKSALEVLDAVRSGSVCPGSYPGRDAHPLLAPFMNSIGFVVFADLIGFCRCAEGVARSAMSLKVSKTGQKFKRQLI